MPHLPRTFTPYLRLACAVAALVAAYACDARPPTDPTPALTPVPLRGNESGDAELGSISLTPTGSYSQFATIPEFAWALVRVSGKWIVESNPACADQPPNWPCSSLAPYSGYDLEYPDAFRGPVRLATISPTGSFDFLELRGSGGPDEGIGLTQREFSRDVLASPALINPTVQQFGNTGPSVASYIIDGSYTVTVTRIASPIRVTEGAAETDGSRTYTVEPLYGLKFINPLGSFDPPGVVRWFFVPGEDVDPIAPNSDPPWRIDECRNLTTCRWTPPGPGRVQVSASVETRRARARSGGGEPPLPQEPKLVLECNNVRNNLSLVRAELIRCAPKTDPGNTPVSITKWEFAGGTGYKFPTADDGPVTDAEWTGPMVISGTITVSGKVGSSTIEQSASVNVTVKARIAAPDQPDLFNVRMGTLADLKPNEQPRVPPATDHDLGMISFAPVVYGNDDPNLAATYFGFVTDGPNTHLAYLTKVPARVNAVVVLNTEMRVGSDFYRRQAHIAQVVTRTCVQEGWQRYIDLILRHEGYPANDQSHSGYYQKKLHEQAWPAVEDIVRPDNQLAQMVGDWRERLIKVFDEAHAYTLRVDREHPVEFGCHFKF